MSADVPTSRGSRERASALLLVPAGTLIALVLASIAVDFSIAFLAERQLAAAAAAAANDAVTLGIDEARFRASGELVLAPDTVRAIVARALSAQDLRLDAPPEVEVEVGPRTVRVTLRSRVRHVFAPVIPGAARTMAVGATATASLRDR